MLVLALTGTDPDRLAEEKAREMTIDLGFAFLSLPGIADAVAIVDVPGHEMFLRNMVAGATGIDAAMLVIAVRRGGDAADRGAPRRAALPADLRGRHRPDQGGQIARDRSPRRPRRRASWRKGTFLENARTLPVSSVTGEGLPALREELARIAARVKARSAEGDFPPAH